MDALHNVKHGIINVQNGHNYPLDGYKGYEQWLFKNVSSPELALKNPTYETFLSGYDRFNDAKLPRNTFIRMKSKTDGMSYVFAWGNIIDSYRHYEYHALKCITNDCTSAGNKSLKFEEKYFPLTIKSVYV